MPSFINSLCQIGAAFRRFLVGCEATSIASNASLQAPCSQMGGARLGGGAPCIPANLPLISGVN